MDKNKLKVLQGIGYIVRKCCGNCAHGSIGLSGFGLCNLYSYEHEKHTESTRPLSINRFGNCIQHKYDTEFVKIIHGFTELLEE